MQHVTRLCGSRLQPRILYQSFQSRLLSSSTSVSKEEETERVQEKTRTLRPRAYGNAALPISALFDPVTVAAREQHEKPKSLPQYDEAQLTDFQRELSQNVFAQALATPIRQCVLTKARLPAHFLIPFITNLPPSNVQRGRETSKPDLQRPQTKENHPLRLKPALAPRIGFTTAGSTRPSSYILASHAALSQLSSPRSKKTKTGSKWALLVNERMRRTWALRLKKSVEHVSAVKEWEWDDNMVGIVKGLLGREVVRKIKWCMAQDEELVGKIDEVDAVAVVRIGGEEEEVGGKEVYDLRSMIDQDLIAELLELSNGARVVALRKHAKTVSAQLALEALRNYIDGDAT